MLRDKNDKSREAEDTSCAEINSVARFPAQDYIQGSIIYENALQGGRVYSAYGLQVYMTVICDRFGGGKKPHEIPTDKTCHRAPILTIFRRRLRLAGKYPEASIKTGKNKEN
jgi:hypothetical protein